MALKFSLAIINDKLDKEETFNGEFNDDEHHLVLDFLQYVKDLLQTSLIENGDFGNFQFLQQEEEIKISVALPNWNDAMLFIYKLRPLILNNERTYFH